MNVNFDPRSPSTSYAGSAPGTPLTSIQNSNIPSVGSSCSLNSPLRPSNANPVHRIQKSAGVKQLYTSDWANGFAYNSNVQAPPRPGSTAPSVSSELSAMSMNSHMSGMSQLSTLTINTNMTGFTQFYASVPQSNGENKKVNIKTPENTEWMNQLMRVTEAHLRNGEADQALDKLKALANQPLFFDLPRPETLNRLFNLIFVEIGRHCAIICKDPESTAYDESLRKWLRFVSTIYHHPNNSATSAIDNTLRERRCQPILDLCRVILPNRKFSLNLVFFISVLLTRRASYKSTIRNNSSLLTVIGNLLEFTRHEFSSAVARGKAITIIRSLVHHKTAVEESLINRGIIQYCLEQILSKELEEVVIFYTLKLLSEILPEKKQSDPNVRAAAMRQFFQAGGIQLITEKFLTHGSSRVVQEALKVLQCVCRSEMAKPFTPVLLHSVFQLYGTNDDGTMALASQIVCMLTTLENRRMMLEFGSVEKALHLLHQMMSWPSKEKEKQINAIADNCLLTLQALGDLDGTKPVKSDVARKIYEWRTIGNENSPYFDAGTLLLSYLGLKVKLRLPILRMLSSMSTDKIFRPQMLPVLVRLNIDMDVVHLLVEIIWKNYREYDSISDKKTSNEVIREACIVLGQLTNYCSETEHEYRMRLIHHLKTDVRNNGQPREPLTLVENLRDDRDVPFLTLIKLLVEKCPESIPVFLTGSQIKVVDELVIQSNSEIQRIGRILQDRMCPHGTTSMMGYPHGFHSLTPQLTPNYGSSSTATPSSVASLISPNPNLDMTLSEAIYNGYQY